MRVVTQGLFHTYLKTFVPLFLPTRLTAPGPPRMEKFWIHASKLVYGVWGGGWRDGYALSKVCGVDHDGKLEKDPIEIVQTKFIRWLLGVNKFCSSDQR